MTRTTIRPDYTKFFAVSLALILFFTSAYIINAAAPTGGYNAGDTRNPDCAPGDVDCFVIPGWSIAGNAGTDDTVNFIGTTDAEDFVIKTNGNEMARFGQNGNIAFGGVSTASGDYATAFGASTASGDASAAFGDSSLASGNLSAAFGLETIASGAISTAFGVETFARSYTETAFGTQNTDYTPTATTTYSMFDRLFSIGNGNGTAHNAYTMWKDGSFAYNDDDFRIDTDGVEQNMFYFGFGNHNAHGNALAKKVIRLGSVDTMDWDIERVAVGDRSVAIGFADTDLSLIAPIASGAHSFAAGTNTIASGDYSTVFGIGNTASGDASIAFGFETIASGDLSTAFGGSTVASGVGAFAIGDTATASGDSSFAGGGGSLASSILAFAFGDSATASGGDAFALGFNTTASGNKSFATGATTTASGGISTAMGVNTFARSGFGEMAIGSWNTDYTPDDTSGASLSDRQFVIGNGVGSGFEHNAYTLWKDGSFAYNDDDFAIDTVGISQNMFYFNYGNHDGAGNAGTKQAIRLGSVDDTEFDITSANVGDKSIALSFVNGGLAASIASGEGSFAAGADNTASGSLSTVFGSGNTASGGISVAIGAGVFARSGSGEVAVGSYNTDYTPVNAPFYHLDDRQFVVGNGFSGAESDAFTILKSGLTGIGFDNFETTSDNDLLQVNGSILQTTATGCTLNADADGTIICTPSDQNLKQDIQDISYGLDTVMQLRPVSYEFINPSFGEGSQIGFIAQELETVIPEVVTNGPDYKSVNYPLLTSVLTKAIQELSLKIDAILNTVQNWLSDVNNGIQKIFAAEIETKKLCVADDAGETTCITKQELDMILLGSIQGGSYSGGSGSSDSGNDNSSGDGAVGTDSGDTNTTGDTPDEENGDSGSDVGGGDSPDVVPDPV